MESQHDGYLQKVKRKHEESIFTESKLRHKRKINLQNKRLELGALINLVDLFLLGHGCVVVALACVGKLLLQFVDLELEDLFALLLLSLSILDQVT